jgi:hypothetical protein
VLFVAVYLQHVLVMQAFIRLVYVCNIAAMLRCDRSTDSVCNDGGGGCGNCENSQWLCWVREKRQVNQ